MTKKQKIFTAVSAVTAVAVTASASAVLITQYPHIKTKKNAKKYELVPFKKGGRGDRIYFLNTGAADAILLESEGKFAIIDAAEDSDNPRGFESLVYEGTEEYVLDCVKKIAGDKDGSATLEFIVGTHSHSDHIGGFDTLILDGGITVKKAYIKKYDESQICEYERTEWDNLEVYNQMIDACKKRQVEIIHNIPSESFIFGNFTLKFFNTEKKNVENKIGENENSLGLLIEKDGKRAFLAGDINNIEGDEDRIGAELGKIDLLKVGHHGYYRSTSEGFVNSLKPDIAVLTNTIYGLNKKSHHSLNKINDAIYCTKEKKGLVADF